MINIFRGQIRTQWRTTPRVKLASGVRRRIPWAIFNENFRREAHLPNTRITEARSRSAGNDR